MRPTAQAEKKNINAGIPDEIDDRVASTFGKSPSRLQPSGKLHHIGHGNNPSLSSYAFSPKQARIISRLFLKKRKKSGDTESCRRLVNINIPSFGTGLT